MERKDLILIGEIGRDGARRVYETDRESMQRHFSPAFIRRVEDRTPVREADERTAAERRTVIESILQEDGAVAGDFRKVTEGGIWTALWYLAEELHSGFQVDMDLFPIPQEVIEICEYTGVHPYYLYSGEDVILAAVTNGAYVIDQLRKQNLSAVCIGYTTDNKDRILKQGETDRYLDRPRKEDELQRSISERKAC